MRITLYYDFGREDDGDFEYEVDVNFSNHLADYLEDGYSDAHGAAEDLSSEIDDEDKKKLLSCRTFRDLADTMLEIDPDWGDELVYYDNPDFFNSEIYEEIKEENYDDAKDAYDEANDGCDPDGFYGWGDYYRWKNGSDCFNK